MIGRTSIGRFWIAGRARVVVDVHAALTPAEARAFARELVQQASWCEGESKPLPGSISARLGASKEEEIRRDSGATRRG